MDSHNPHFQTWGKQPPRHPQFRPEGTIEQTVHRAATHRRYSSHPVPLGTRMGWGNAMDSHKQIYGLTATRPIRDEFKHRTAQNPSRSDGMQITHIFKYGKTTTPPPPISSRKITHIFKYRKPITHIFKHGKIGATTKIFVPYGTIEKTICGG